MTVYAPEADRARMFSLPRYVIKGGVLVVEEGQLRRAPAGRRLRLAPGHDQAVVTDLRRFYDEYGTVAFDNFPVRGLRDAPLELG